MNEAANEAGGIYLFKDEAAVNEYLGGSIVNALKTNPVVSDIRVKMFDVSEAHTLVTRGPIGRAVSV
jgi:Putative mono-oxygenase ydhR